MGTPESAKVFKTASQMTPIFRSVIAFWLCAPVVVNRSWIPSFRNSLTSSWFRNSVPESNFQNPGNLPVLDLTILSQERIMGVNSDLYTPRNPKVTLVSLSTTMKRYLYPLTLSVLQYFVSLLKYLPKYSSSGPFCSGSIQYW